MACMRIHFRRENNPAWKGGVDASGYRKVSVDGKIHVEHRLIMSRHLGRNLQKFEIVHHKNGDRLDNRIENLEICVNESEYTHPNGQRISDLISFVISNYKSDVMAQLGKIMPGQWLPPTR